ncbi:DUF6049 family protein [Nonomuraea sp. NBC_01738]|uniref:DUF6049 family protein n=1 Tax=Nonomuraea sp. NBC_01738 TaxID=2976003 RepID=UPI002E0E4D09|nr:DUF6049 family protein [Nonomuraea sp. NBC_01738]
MIRKATLLAVLSAALLAPMVATTPGTAAATANRQTLGLTVKSITPEVARTPQDEIKLSGTIRNGTAAALAGLRVTVRYSGQRFLDRASMKVFQSGQAARLPNVSQSSFQDIPALDVNSSVDWQLTITPGQLGLSSFGAYPISVEVVQGGWQQLAVSHTFVTYMPPTTPKLPRNRLAVALPVIDQPHRGADATFLDNKLSDELKSGGRLDALAQIAKAAPKNVTWFVDPALLDDVTAMTKSYSVKGTATPADASAAPWLESLRTAMADVPVVAVPYGDPDVTALAHQGLDGGVERAVRVGGSVAARQIKRDVSTTAYWPVAGVLDDDAVDLLAVSKVNTVLLNPVNLPPQTPATTTLDAAASLDSVAGPVTALLPDEELSRTLEIDAASGGSAVLNRQRFVAETAMIAAEPGQLTPRSLVIAPSRRWDPDPAYVLSLLKTASRLPWLTTAPLSSIKAAKVQTPRGGLVYTDQDRKQELSGKFLEPVKDVTAKADLATQITTEKRPAGFDTAVTRLTSAGWRNNTRAGRAATKQVNATVDDRLGKVAITGAGRDQPRTLAGVDGQVPISVRNGLSSSVTLQVDVSSNNPGLLQIDSKYDKKPLVVGAGQSATVQVPMTVKTSGDASITVQLETADGLPYGDAVKLTIRTTGYTGIALVIVGGALSVMLAAVVTRVLRRRSQKRPARTPATRESEKV